MHVLYNKKGEKAICDLEQIEIMKDAGFTFEESPVVEKEEVKAPVKETPKSSYKKKTDKNIILE